MRRKTRKSRKSRKYKKYTKHNKRYTKRNKRYTKRNKRYTKRNKMFNKYISNGGSPYLEDIQDNMLSDARILYEDELFKFDNNNNNLIDKILCKVEWPLGDGEDSFFIKWLDIYKGVPHIPFTPFGHTYPECSEDLVIKGINPVPHRCTNFRAPWTFFITTLDELISELKKAVIKEEKDINTINVNELCPILTRLLGYNPSSVIPVDAKISLFKSHTPEYIRLPCGLLPQAGSTDTCGYDKDKLPLNLCDITPDNKYYNIRKLADNNLLCSGEEQRGNRSPFTGNGYTYYKFGDNYRGVREFIAIQSPKHEVTSGGSISINELIDYLKYGIEGIDDRFEPN